MDRKWDKTTFRVTKIPSGINLLGLVEILKELFKLETSDFRVHSLAADVSDEKDPSTNTATVSFRNRPSFLNDQDGLLDECPGWSLDFPFAHVIPGGSQRIHFDTHFQGFTPLSPAEYVNKQTIEYESLIKKRLLTYETSCILIPGWGAHALGSFRSFTDTYVWVRDSLPKDCSTLRVWTYGYHSELLEKRSVGDVYEYAKTFARLLRILREGKKMSHLAPIIFMAHSLGGLVFKEAMIQLCESQNEDDRLILKSTYGAVFFGVPGQGMNIEAYTSMLQELPARFTMNHLDQQIGSHLRLRDQALFCTSFTYQDSKIFSFYESHKTKTVIWDLDLKRWVRNGPLVLLVNQGSAICGRQWETGHEYSASLEGDHSSMVKLSQNDCINYKQIRQVLRDFISQAGLVVERRFHSNSPLSEKQKLAHPSLTLDSPIIPATKKALEPPEFTDNERKCLQSLSFPEMAWRRSDIDDSARNTSTWLLNHQTYQKWFDHRRGLLWIKGKPGAGKSTVMKYVLKRSEEEASARCVIASFFFHNRGTLLQKNSLGLFRSLLHQILQEIRPALALLTSLFEKRCQSEGEFGKTWSWRERDLQEFFESSVISAANEFDVRIYIDALDECGEQAASKLVDFFQRISFIHPSPESCFSICFSCRHYPIIALENGLEVHVERENSQDINTYVRDYFNNHGLGERSSQVQKLIIKKSSNTFQWVVLVVPRVVRSFKRGKSAKAVANEVDNTPIELGELYRKLLQDIEDQDRPQSLRLMQWLCFAIRPLTLAELRVAMVLDANTTYISIQECKTSSDYVETDDDMKKRVCDLSAGLIEVKFQVESDQKEQNFAVRSWEAGIVDLEHFQCREVAQFIHESVSDFLLQESAPGILLLGSALANNMPGLCHFQLSRSCVKYLAMEEILQIDHTPNLDGKTLFIKFPFLRYAVECWIFHAQGVEEAGLPQNDLISSLSPHPNRALQNWIMISRFTPIRSKSKYLFNTTLIHVSALYNLKSLVTLLLLYGFEQADSKDSKGRTPLSLAAQEGHEATTKMLMEREDVDVNLQDTVLRSPLSYAVDWENVEIVKLLLEREDVDVNLQDQVLRSPLSYAAQWGREEIVKLLIEREDVDINLQDKALRSPLSYAVKWGRVKIAKLLIEQKDVDVNLQDKDLRSPLSYAAQWRSEEKVKLLLEREDVDVNLQDQVLRSPLSYAAQWGREEIVKLLILREDVDVNLQDKDLRSPLSYAASNGHVEIVKLLVGQKDLDINSRDERGMTSLNSAAIIGDEAVVKLLLERDDVDVDSKDIDGRTPFSWAAQQGNQEVVKLLLERKDVNVNSKDIYNQTPLSLAAELRPEQVTEATKATETPELRKNKHEVVKLLLERNDVDVDAKDVYGQTPLFLAAGTDFKKVVSLLLEKGAKADTEDIFGETPLSIAVDYHNEKAASLLREHLSRSSLNSAAQERNQRRRFHVQIEIEGTIQSFSDVEMELEMEA